MSNAEMDVHRIIGFLDQFDFKHFSIQSKDLQIEAVAASSDAETHAAPVSIQAAAPSVAAPQARQPAPDGGRTGPEDGLRHTYLRSPALGVFAGGDGGQALRALEGKNINAGQLLGVVRMRDGEREVVAPCDAEIVKVCVAEGEFVAYGRTLFIARNAKRGVAAA